jgi:hypothetical protein
MVRDWLELASQPPQSVLDSNPDAKAQQRAWLHRRLNTAAGAGALKMTKTAAAPGEVQGRCEPRFDQIPRHSSIQRCSARACRSCTILARIAQRGYTSWEPRLCQWINSLAQRKIKSSRKYRNSKRTGRCCGDFTEARSHWCRRREPAEKQ